MFVEIAYPGLAERLTNISLRIDGIHYLYGYTAYLERANALVSTSDTTIPLSTVRAHLSLLLATTLVAGSFLASAQLADTISPYSLTLMRFVGATLAMLPFILLRAKTRSGVLGVLPRAALISLFYCGFFVAFFEALKTTTPLNTGALFTLVPLVTAGLSAVLLSNRISLKILIMYLCGAIGAIWVITRGELDRLVSLTSLQQGDGIFLLAVCAMSMYTVSMKWLYRNDDMLAMVFGILFCGSIWMSGLLAITETPLGWTSLAADSWLSMLYLILAATLVTTFLYQRAAVNLGPDKVSAYIFLNPALVGVLGWIVLQQPLEIGAIPGVVLSCVATVLLQLKSFRVPFSSAAERKKEEICSCTKC